MRVELPLILLAAVSCFAISAVLTGLVRTYGLRHSILDVPNARSSHTLPTPRGGGLAIVLSYLTSIVVLFMVGRLESSLALAFAGGVLVAGVGFLDDRAPQRASVRLMVHFVSAGWALYALEGAPGIVLGSHVMAAGPVMNLLAAVAFVWVINLFNFMDGIDGLAASEALFIGLAGVLVSGLASAASSLGAASILLAAACGGFLLWNWAPARIFMGDIGSGFLGYVVAVLALQAAHQSDGALYAWLVLGGLFFVDATVTLLRRLARGDRPHEAHRTHAYQRLARKWESHGKVTLLYGLVNLLWCLPLAALAYSRPHQAFVLLCIAILPLALAAHLLGAGRRE